MSTFPPYQAILFDLDGTLTDPFDGIARSLVYALEKLGYEAPDPTSIRNWIGPPLHDSFAAYLGSVELAQQAVVAYRERYEPIGAFENLVYPGIPELLGALRAAGCRLAVATSKLESIARTVIEHFELADYFEVVVGSSRDGLLSAKSAIIGIALDRLVLSDSSSVVMVGDRSYDVLGARANGLPCIAVGFGYGSDSELRASEPLAIAKSVEDLRTLLL